MGILSTYLAGGTTTMSGTSMATPHVAGVAALIKAVKPSATGAEIADILRDTARPLKDNAADPVPNNAYGHGCLDANAALVKARGPVIKPTITVHLRTPIIACPPRTLVINQCPPPHSVFQPLCPPKTIRINECGLLITKIPAICPPVTITRPPITVACPRPTTFPTTIRTVPTQPIHRGAAVGYDPYGVLGETAASGDEAPGATYQAGYEAGYAAAVAELGEAMAASGAESDGGAESAGGAGEDVQAGPGDDVLPALPAVPALLLPADRHRAVLLRAADGQSVAVRSEDRRYAVVPGRDPHLAATDPDHALPAARPGRVRRGLGL